VRSLDLSLSFRVPVNHRTRFIGYQFFIGFSGPDDELSRYSPFLISDRHSCPTGRAYMEVGVGFRRNHPGGWEPIGGLSPHHRGDSRNGTKGCLSLRMPGIVPSNRRLRFDGPPCSASAIRPDSSDHAFVVSMGFMRLLTAFSLGAAAPNRQSGCDNRGLQRAFAPILLIREEAL
jgi:hypothetical protein